GGNDQLQVDATTGNDTVTTPAANTLQVNTGTVILGPGLNSLVVNTGDGNDSVNFGPNLNYPGLFRTVNGGNGDDTLTLNDSAGLADFPEQIEYNGGNGNNTLIFTGGLTATNTHYSVGPDTGAGVVTQTFAGGAQTVTFTGLAPVQDNIAATTLTIDGTN